MCVYVYTMIMYMNDISVYANVLESAFELSVIGLSNKNRFYPFVFRICATINVK